MPHPPPTNHASPPRRASNLRGLLLLNVLLLALLAAVTFGSSADAQGRVRGEYTMAGGPVNGTGSAAVYVVDVVNQELMAVTYNQNTKQLDGIGYRNLALDAANRSGHR